jgi:spore coat polysaccharide biosynthesis protein SpsF
MKTLAIIQARMGSTRLPGKVLKDLGGQTVMARVLRRVSRMRAVDEMIVATTSGTADDPVVGEASRNGVPVYRGSDEDVLDRYYQAACLSKADVIVRITADCPLIDPGVSDRVIDKFLDVRPDYASNTLERTYPRGLDTEVASFATLQRAWEYAREPYQRAHVTPYIYQNGRQFRLFSVKGIENYSHHRWTLDTPEDLEFLRGVYAKLSGNEDLGWQDVLKIVESDPALSAINRHICQKALSEG